MYIVNKEIDSEFVKVSLWPSLEEFLMSLEDALSLAKSLKQDLTFFRYDNDNVAHCEIRDISQYLYDNLLTHQIENQRKIRHKIYNTRHQDGLSTSELGFSLNSLKMEINPDLLIRKWGDKRQRANLANLMVIEIPDDSKVYMSLVGLPKEEWDSIRFNLKEDFINLNEVLIEGNSADNFAYEETLRRLGREIPDIKRKFNKVSDIEFSKYWCIGYSEFQTICIEEGTGSIYIINVEGDENFNSKMYINSNIELLGQFIYLFGKTYEEAEEKPLSEYEVSQLEKKFKKMDRQAMMDIEGGYWPNMVRDLAVF